MYFYIYNSVYVLIYTRSLLFHLSNFTFFFSQYFLLRYKHPNTNSLLPYSHLFLYVFWMYLRQLYSIYSFSLSSWCHIKAV